MKLSFRLLKILFVCFLPMLLSGCGDDDKDEPVSSNPLIGSWYLDWGENQYSIFTFYEGGIFSAQDWEQSGPCGEDLGSYKFDDKNGILVLAYDDDDTDTNKVTFADNNNTMFWIDEDNETWRLTRVK